MQGLDTTEGVLLFGKEHFYVLDGFTLISTKDIVDIDCLKAGAYEPLIPRSSTNSTTSPPPSQATEKSCSKFAYEDIREVHKRRYLLQPIALEIFSNDGRNYLLVFPRKCRNKVYERLLALTPDVSDSAQQSIAGQKRNMSVEQGVGLLNSLIGEKSVTQRWERGEITNFQYLMYLNTLAGRSYNDLMQYPVFPWILADYDSPHLDLSAASTFRDLSKPMGAQTPDRLKQFQKRYQEWDDPSGETPPYHYGTHYSSAMIVASYLVRMEPFSQIFLRLQGGHFDLADRMFHSIKDNWLSASRNNMADVKELIPEFFYLPEFLVNSNRFDFGRKQNGVVLNDVVLPTWAKNDPREFIRVHRMALESDYVSAHLNEWIDLIFGHKQQGAAAVDAVNCFHHLFYEGAVDIDDINDPLKRNAIIGFINNFGQIPKQLFKKPHPCKKLSAQLIYGIPIPSEKVFFFQCISSLKASNNPVKELKAPVGQIVISEKGAVVAVEHKKCLMPPSYQRYVAWGFADENIKIGWTDYEKSYVAFESVQEGAVLCCTSPDSRLIITGGTSTTVNIWEMGKSGVAVGNAARRNLQLKAKLYAHTDAVTCLAVSRSYHMLVSGSRDHTCVIWDLNRCRFVRQLGKHAGEVACICINEINGDIATVASTFLYLWSINGELLASVNTMPVARSQVILSLCMSQINEWDEDNVVMTGSSDGVVRMWSLDYKQVPIESAGLKSSNGESELTPNNLLEMLRKSSEGNDGKSRTMSSPGESDNENDDSNSTGNPSSPVQLHHQPQQTQKSQQSQQQQQQNSVEKKDEADDDFVLVSKNELVDKARIELKPGLFYHFFVFLEFFG